MECYSANFLSLGASHAVAILCGIRAADLYFMVLTFLRLMMPDICLQFFANCNNSLISICQYVLFPRVFIYPHPLIKKTKTKNSLVLQLYCQSPLYQLMKLQQSSVVAVLPSPLYQLKLCTLVTYFYRFAYMDCHLSVMSLILHFRKNILSIFTIFLFSIVEHF